MLRAGCCDCYDISVGHEFGVGGSGVGMYGGCCSVLFVLVCLLLCVLCDVFVCGIVCCVVLFCCIGVLRLLVLCWCVSL